MQINSSVHILFVSANSIEHTNVIEALKQRGYQVTVTSYEEGSIEHIQNSVLPSLAIIDAKVTVDHSEKTIDKMVRAVSDMPKLFIAGASNIKTILNTIHPAIDDCIHRPVDEFELALRTNWLIQRCYPDIPVPISY